ncbi:cellulase family glycosylhydrolase [Archangium violaceum]|uniref:glycoside hydrolase family 5 protein n=1 Tax=Archangium violaceum TaxID=83451 RepID=UPI00193BB442|nr:cellulase family glycosylhydrolase [Archangium violaceum]QRK06433.1 cellulase family glycosylhydrolase [Archangium violaceum]
MMRRPMKMACLLAFGLLACGGPEWEADEELGTEEAAVANPTGRFYIVGKDIVGPSGNKFYPVGANLDGWDFFQRDTENHAEAAKKWGWNIVRINGAQLPHPEFNTKGLVSGDLSKPNFDKIDRIVQAYTSRGIVVMIEFHDKVWNGNSIDTTKLNQTRDAWVALAKKYKSNTFVWFNLLNEPTWGQSEANYLSVHKTLRNAIRATGAENIIVIDGGVAGQEWNRWGIPGNLIPRYGPELAKDQCNILFSIHMYNAWAEAGGSSPHNAEFISYVKSVQDKKLALIVGETGWNKTDGDVPRLKAGSLVAFNNAPAYGVGIIGWHGTPNWDDTFFLTSSGQFHAVNDWSNPTNLTDFGKKLWALSKNKPKLGAFTGNYADSRCASAK